MGKKKSLGSTPIGYDVDRTSYTFIRDIGESERKEQGNLDGEGEDLKDQATDQAVSETAPTPAQAERGKKQNTEEENEKKIVSYYLEIELVDRLKQMANEQNSYYSAVVSRAIQAWVEYHGF